MMFKFLQRPVVLDCFTTSETTAKVAPILPAIRYAPEWWKALPNKLEVDGGFFPRTTMKKCQGFIDLYKKSVVIPLWSDLAVEVTAEGRYRWQFSDFASEAGVHDAYQRGSFLPPNKYGHIKLSTPWMLHTKKNISWVFSQAFYNFDAPDAMLIPPGILNFSQQPVANINTIIDITKPKKFLLEVGQPLCFLTPITDRPVEVVRHVVSEAEIKKFYELSKNISFTNSFLNRLAKEKQFKDCPFKTGM